MLTGEKGAWDCPVRISLLGPVGPEARAHLEIRLKQDKLLKAGQLKQTRQENDARRAMGLKSGRSSAGFRAKGVVEQPEVSLHQLVQASQAVQLRPSDDIVKTLALSEDELAKMPMAPQPAQLKSTLLPYQLQGLAWLTKKEAPQFPAPGSPETVQLWKRTAHGNHTNLATNFTVKAPPTLMSGGILGDDMGLGKTIQVISLILTGGGKGPTLIVAPVSVMSNWDQQVRRHVLEEHAPRLLIYHGSARSASVGDLSKYDIIVTSYGTLSSEVNGGPLFSVTWRRVVLDEGHTIRNAKTKIAEAACALQAQSRWVLTGTPMYAGPPSLTLCPCLLPRI
jgi:SWI/SNF-related matrix-associated actin-dependent regulator of chromatin subfamily A3